MQSVMTEADGLGSAIKTARFTLGLSLIKTATPAAISATYLQKIESGEAKHPSPHILHRLSGVLGVPYVHLMELAGYVAPNRGECLERPPVRVLPVGDLTPDERRAVAAFIAYLRSVRARSP